MIKLVTDESLKHNLEEIVRLGAKKMFMQALEAEISDVIHKLKNEVDDKGNRLVVRNGKSKKKSITLGSGSVDVETPRVHDR
jgi:putative transposase